MGGVVFSVVVRVAGNEELDGSNDRSGSSVMLGDWVVISGSALI